MRRHCRLGLRSGTNGVTVYIQQGTRVANRCERTQMQGMRAAARRSLRVLSVVCTGGHGYINTGCNVTDASVPQSVHAGAAGLQMSRALTSPGPALQPS